MSGMNSSVFQTHNWVQLFTFGPSQFVTFCLKRQKCSDFHTNTHTLKHPHIFSTDSAGSYLCSEMRRRAPRYGWMDGGVEGGGGGWKWCLSVDIIHPGINASSVTLVTSPFISGACLPPPRRSGASAWVCLTAPAFVLIYLRSFLIALLLVMKHCCVSAISQLRTTQPWSNAVRLACFQLHHHKAEAPGFIGSASLFISFIGMISCSRLETLTDFLFQNLSFSANWCLFTMTVKYLFNFFRSQ